MKKVIILGAADGQIPFILECKRKGASVIVVSPQGNYGGFRYADKCYYCDTRDKDGILQIARKEKINAVLTDQTDVSVPTAAYVAEKMGLKGIGYEKSLDFTDKYRMRRAAERCGVGVPRYTKVQTVEEAIEAGEGINYPVMMKPTNSSGSRGVYRARGAGDIRKHFSMAQRHSSTNEVMIEEFIEGREYIADGLALDHKYLNLDLGIKKYFDKPNMYISKMCMFSSAALVEAEAEKKVLETNRKLIEGMHLNFGITHGEYIYSEREERVYLVEIAARGGGVYLSSELTPRASGVNTNEILIDYVLNDTKVNLEKIKLKKRVAAWRCFELPEGEIVEIEHAGDVLSIPGVFKACLNNLHISDYVGELTDDTKKHGPILVEGASREECFEILARVKDILKIRTRKDGETRDIIW